MNREEERQLGCMYKVPSGSSIDTCFSSDFFHADADEWRDKAWDMIRKRNDCIFFMITKRPERIGDHLPADWNDGWEHVTIAVTCENQAMIEKRLPVYLDLPIPHRSVMVEPMLERVNIRPYFQGHPGAIERVAVGGESGPNARPCDFEWVKDVYSQCMENGASFYYHQTGARLIKDGKEVYIPRREQHWRARLAMNESVNCDIAMIPIGGTFTMDAREAAELVNKIKPQVAIPIHYGSIAGSKGDEDILLKGEQKSGNQAS